ncbi:uncharacterized protein LOC132736740 [Ruditapes philippinarum]|uniref:uncharacterized protein LOC132736740 n=1 Tax=Ruditapes philippinarum TaxID=129788 RepID=UPI00295A882C|nr:uncharacterized protein LOC132736740 [Ruditapes philippinarum]
MGEVVGAKPSYPEEGEIHPKGLPANICQPCLNEGNEINSHKFCIECNEYLCTSCIEAHNRFSTTKTHHLTENKLDLNFNQSINAGRCLYHMDRYLDHFCVSHDEYCCVSCLNTRHRSCQQKLSINEMSETVTDKDLADAEERKEKCIMKIEEVKKACKKGIDTLDIERQDAMNFLESFRTDLFVAFNNLHENNTATIERKYRTIRTKLEADLKTCSDMENNLEKGHVVLKCKDEAMHFINMRKLLRVTDMTQATAEAMSSDANVKHFQLTRSSLCLKILNQPELLIEIADRTRIYKETGISNILREFAIGIFYSEFYKSVYKEPSSLIIPLKESVFVYNTMKNISEEIDFPDLVSSVEKVKNNFFAALPNKGVVVCPTGNKNTQVVLKTNEPCIGIVKSSTSFYVTVRVEKTGQLRKYTSAGKLDDVLKSNEKGDSVFTDRIGEVKISKDEKKIYVVDTKTGIVIVSAKPYSLIKIISNVKEPQGIALIQAESMFILLSDGTVTQTTDDGKSFYNVIEKGTHIDMDSIGRKDYHSICWDGFATLFVIFSQSRNLKILQHQLNFKNEY